MRVIFFGTAEFAVPSLERLVTSGHRVVLCVTRPDRPQGRGLKPEPSPVKQAAERLHIAVVQPERLTTDALRGHAADIGVLAAYGQIVRRDVLEGFSRGMVGVHPSMLPKYRGAAPVAWALLNGETRTGLTIFQMNERLDAGDILLQKLVDIEPHEDAAALTARLARLGGELAVRALDAAERGSAHLVPQDDGQASYAPKLSKTQGRIDWNAPAAVIERMVRATTPWPGAVTAWRGEPLKIVRAALAPAIGSKPPGAVMQAGPDALIVATGEGALAVTELQPAGRRRLSAREFLAGYKVQVGDRFGDDK